MAHIRAAIFSFSDKKPESLISQQLSEIHIDKILFTTSDFATLNKLDLQMFVTAEGEVISIDQLRWLGLSNTLEECNALFGSILKAYFVMTVDVNLHITVVDCRI